MSDPPLLEFRSVSTTYTPGLPVLQDVSFSVQSGQRVGLLGPNGSGKSTLLHAVFGEGGKRTGEILVLGRSIDSMPPRERARHISLLPQQVRGVFPFTVREWISLGLYPRNGPLQAPDSQQRQRVTEALLHNHLGGMENRPVDQLSGGEWQRLQLARIFVQEGKLWCLDEPTTHLDPRIQRNMANALLQAHAARPELAFLAVMHDLGFAMRLCDRFLFLKDGRLVADGAAAETMTPSRLSALFDTPMEALHDASRQAAGFSWTHHVDPEDSL